jgi:hypothetical protein
MSHDHEDLKHYHLNLEFYGNGRAGVDVKRPLFRKSNKNRNIKRATVRDIEEIAKKIYKTEIGGNPFYLTWRNRILNSDEKIRNIKVDGKKIPLFNSDPKNAIIINLGNKPYADPYKYSDSESNDEVEDLHGSAIINTINARALEEYMRRQQQQPKLHPDIKEDRFAFNMLIVCEIDKSNDSRYTQKIWNDPTKIPSNFAIYYFPIYADDPSKYDEFHLTKKEFFNIIIFDNCLPGFDDITAAYNLLKTPGNIGFIADSDEPFELRLDSDENKKFKKMFIENKKSTQNFHSYKKIKKMNGGIKTRKTKHRKSKSFRKK